MTPEEEGGLPRGRRLAKAGKPVKYPPVGTPRLTELFLSLGENNAGEPWSWAEIAAWQEVTGWKVTAWEAEALRAMSTAFCGAVRDFYAKQSRAPYGYDAQHDNAIAQQLAAGFGHKKGKA